ncbi:histidine phosphatase family protein [Actinocorallia longicatena]|uniref:Histidine phosphatase family protein n=1 Tax=Actinocorallia longicatena TaxID=111803 RepID=A0ABP6QA49_9ACTN
MSKRLAVLRHSKAVQVLGLADHERSLAERGRGDAAAMGGYLRSSGVVPDQVLCSTALRTRETLDGLALGDVPVAFERGIYIGDGYDLLTLIQITEDDVDTLLLVGHNPAVHELVLVLSGESVPEFPTSALAVIEMEDWSVSGGRLLDYRTPKTI